MYTRGLGQSLMSPDGMSHQVVNFSNLQHFESETVNNINDLMDYVNVLLRKTELFEKAIAFCDWVAETYPEIVDNYKTAERVARRIEGDTPQEVCEVQA
jgi:GrpB-like predicted nucleotidyltransferase (UPF0157 family)